MRTHTFALKFTPLSAAIILFGLALIFAFTTEVEAAQQLYTCGMHPQIIKKEPGDCPICGMKLTPIRNNSSAAASSAKTSGEKKVKYYKSTMIPGQISQTPAKDTMGMDMVPVYEGEDASGENNIHIDAATTQRMNLKTALVERGPVRREFRTVGTVAYNERGLRDITTKYEGWLEKLHVDATWTFVKAGDPLFDIYSPDIYNAQLNYLVALRSEGAAGGPLTRAALARMQLFDLHEDFIAELTRTGEVHRTYTFRAPTDGVVIEKMAIVGQMIKAGEKIYRLADLSSVWVLAQIYEKDLPFVHEGQQAEVRTSYGERRVFDGKVQQLLPQVEEQTRTATARIVLANPDRYLRPGMFTDVKFATQLAASAVLVPDMAVLRSGERNTVFIVKEGGDFEPREITLGVRSEGDFYEVLSGLAAGERVVTSGQFMLDSESELREAIQKMLKSAEGTPATDAPATPTTKGPSDARKILHYQSSMAPEETSMKPAKDSMGMDMVPVYEEPAPASSAAMPESAESSSSAKNDGSAMQAEPAAGAAESSLKSLAFVLADASAVLAADDLAGYQKQLPALRAALADYFAADAHAEHGRLGKFKDGLPERNNLKSARADFAPLSTAVSDMVRAHHLHHATGLHIFECPMAPVIGTGRWFQRDAILENPFFGSAMSDCGTEINAPSASIKTAPSISAAQIRSAP